MEKRLLTVMVVVGALCSVALAGGPLGPPMSVLDHGQWAIDLGYFYEEVDLFGCGTWGEDYRDWVWAEGSEPNAGSWGDWEVDWRWHQKIKLEGLETNTWLASLEYGLCDNWDIIVRVGAADAQGDLIIAEYEEWYDEGEEEWECGWDVDKESVDFDYGFAWQVGAAFTVCRSGPWTFGGRLLFGMADPGSYSESWSEEYEDEDDGSGVEKGKVNADIEWWQAVAYMGAAYEVSDALQLYLGGGWQTMQGTLDLSWRGTEYYDYYDDGVQPMYPYEGERGGGRSKVKHASAIGVFGLSWAPTADTNVGVELIVGEGGKWGIGVMGALAMP